MEEQSPPWYIAFLIIVLFPICFAGMWSLVLFINAHIGGWARLAQDHRRDGDRPDGAHLCTGNFRVFMSYSHVLYVAGTPEGLHLSVMKLFFVAHPNLLIPWDRCEDLGPSALPFKRWTKLRLDGVSVTIPEDVWENVKRQRP